MPVLLAQSGRAYLLPPTVVSGQTFLGFPKPLPQFRYLQVPETRATINKQTNKQRDKHTRQTDLVALWNPRWIG